MYSHKLSRSIKCGAGGTACCARDSLLNDRWFHTYCNLVSRYDRLVVVLRNRNGRHASPLMQAASHQRQGWETFTDRVIGVVSADADPVVFILWGSAARKKTALIDTMRHHVIESPHPSPLSAHRGFFGSRPFSRANEALVAAGREPVDWRL